MSITNDIETKTSPNNIPEPSEIGAGVLRWLDPRGSTELTEDNETYRLGNPELPIAAYRPQIIQAVDNSQAVVITAETGAGKTTQVPQFLVEDGYRVIVTQPRRVAARSVSERVREEIVAAQGESYADFVGYRTADPRDRDDTKDNHILFVTDGLQLVRELSGSGVGKKQVLVLDEVHEWNENMEVLVAWALQRMREDPELKVVVMSATMESQKLAEFLADNQREVPIVEVPGRTFEVKKSEGGDVIDETIKRAKGRSGLVFVPGKQEIADVITDLSARNELAGVTILPCHGQLPAEEQRKVFQHYPGGVVIVGTNVLQTSVTIPDVDYVIDSGLERRIEVKNGVEGLFLRPVSRADCLQRAGRAGRAKEGEYVLAKLGKNAFVPLDEREAYGAPEIVRTRLDGMVLRLARGGLDAEKLDFYHQPPRSEISDAKNRLIKLGALTEDGRVTRIGRDMAQMRLESHNARMMIEARQYGPEIQRQLAAILAIQEMGGVTFRGKNSQHRWVSLTSPDNRSDLITELEVFVAAQRMSTEEQRDNDIITKNLSRAREVLRQLRETEHLPDADITLPTAEQRDQLIRCIVAGMVDHLYIQVYDHGITYYGGSNRTRELSNRSGVGAPKMLVAQPYDLDIMTRRGPMVLHIIQGATIVPSMETLREVAPQLFRERPTNNFRFTEDGQVERGSEVIFNGTTLPDTIWYPAEPSSERRDFITRYLLLQRRGVFRGITSLLDTSQRLENLQDRTTEELPKLEVDDWLSIIPEGVATLAEADELLPVVQITDYLSQDKIDDIMANSPDKYLGMSISYRNGVPSIYASYHPEGWADLSDQQLALPDGREIFDRNRNVPLSELRRNGIKIVERQKVEKAERQRLEEQRERERAEQAAEAERLAAERAAEAERLAAEEAAAEDRRIQEEAAAAELAMQKLNAARQRAAEVAEKLDELSDDPDFEFLPDDIYDDLTELQLEYSRGFTFPDKVDGWINRTNQAVSKARQHIKDINRTGVASSEDLAKLAAFFNR